MNAAEINELKETGIRLKRKSLKNGKLDPKVKRFINKVLDLKKDEDRIESMTQFLSMKQEPIPEAFINSFANGEVRQALHMIIGGMLCEDKKVD